MKKQLLKLAGVLAISSIVLLAGCEKQEPVPDLKYTVWCGSPTFGIGHQTDIYSTEGEWIEFVDKYGKRKRLNKESVYEIDINY